VLDHIFYNRQLAVAGHSVRPTDASDHCVVLGDFEFA
jgi:endonuclease/exonuclease/phosphatase (EEP) superfamily protein YafD